MVLVMVLVMIVILVLVVIWRPGRCDLVVSCGFDRLPDNQSWDEWHCMSFGRLTSYHLVEASKPKPRNCRLVR